MFHLVQFLKCWQLFLELNSKRVNRSSRKEKESFCLVFTYSTEKCTKNHDARAQLLFFAHLTYCFCDVLVAVAFVSLSLIKPRANGRNIVGCYMLCLMLGGVAPFAHHCNTDATTRNIVAATMLGVVVSVCTSLKP